MPGQDTTLAKTPAAAEISRWMEVAAILDEVFAASEATPETDLKVAREALVQSAAAHVKAVRRIDELLGGQTGATAE